MIGEMSTIFLYGCSLRFLQEKDAKDVEIPNIRWEIFELMMRFIFIFICEMCSVVPDFASSNVLASLHLFLFFSPAGIFTLVHWIFALMLRKIYLELLISIFWRGSSAFVSIQLHRWVTQLSSARFVIMFLSDQLLMNSLRMHRIYQ